MDIIMCTYRLIETVLTKVGFSLGLVYINLTLVTTLGGQNFGLSLSLKGQLAINAL